MRPSCRSGRDSPSEAPGRDCGRISTVAELHFFTGTMDSGKSTLALQTNHNHAVRGRIGRIFTTHDRAGEALLSSRLGLTHDAIEVTGGFDFWRYVVGPPTPGGPGGYPIFAGAPFSRPGQIRPPPRGARPPPDDR